MLDVGWEEDAAAELDKGRVGHEGLLDKFCALFFGNGCGVVGIGRCGALCATGHDRFGMDPSFNFRINLLHHHGLDLTNAVNDFVLKGDPVHNGFEELGNG